MWKSIFTYSLFAFIYFGFSIIPFTEVSAQTMTITAGETQNGVKQGEEFASAVTFKLTDVANDPITSAAVSFVLRGCEGRETGTGTFSTTIADIDTDSNGTVTIDIRAAAQSYYNRCVVSANHIIGTTNVSKVFVGTITDVLYFSSDGTFANKITSTTRSVAAGTAANTNIGAAVSATHWANADTDTSNDVTLVYGLEGTDAASFNLSATGQLSTNTTMGAAGTSYSVTVKVRDLMTIPGDPQNNPRSSTTINVTITVTSAPVFTEGTSTTRSVPENTPAGQNIGAPVAATDADTGDTLTYTLGGTDAASFRINSTNGQLRTSAALDYERKTTYSVIVSVSDGTGGSDSITVTINVTDVTNEPVLPPVVDTPPPVISPNLPPADTTSPVDTNIETEQTPQKRRIRYECPVGWTRGSVFGETKKALIYELKVNVDLTNTISIYQLKSLAIYVHPEENLETLEGWYLTTGILYNHDHENKLHLTTENSVIDEHGFAHIENPEATPIRMGTLGFIGQSLPSFDYRLYDERGARVDFGISCYKEGGLTFRLWNTEDPRVLRVLPFPISDADLSVRMKELDWQTPFFRTQWTAAIMPDLPDAPAAPSQIKKNIVGTWADLKKQ